MVPSPSQARCSGHASAGSASTATHAACQMNTPHPASLGATWQARLEESLGNEGRLHTRLANAQEATQQHQATIDTLNAAEAALRSQLKERSGTLTAARLSKASGLAGPEAARLIDIVSGVCLVFLGSTGAAFI